MPRDGRFIEKLGTYNPLLPKDSEERVKMNMERSNTGCPKVPSQLTVYHACWKPQASCPRKTAATLRRALPARPLRPALKKKQPRLPPLKKLQTPQLKKPPLKSNLPALPGPLGWAASFLS